MDKNAQAHWRGQALGWLKADLAAWEKSAEEGITGNFTFHRALAVRKLHPDLSAVRDPDALASLSENERKDWKKFWARVDELLERSR